MGTLTWTGFVLVGRRVFSFSSKARRCCRCAGVINEFGCWLGVSQAMPER